MGFVVLHMEKAHGSDSGTTAHIERFIIPKNADPTRTHLNRKLIEYPEGVKDRSAAIQRRLEEAGLTRKIGSNQVRAIRINVSATPEDMERIEREGRLDEWCADNLKYFADTFGKENIVAAHLHLDEKTPHMHVTLVPIVKGERKRKKREEQAKKRYRKKPTDTVRLCADDIMSRLKLKGAATTAATNIAESVGSLFGSNKVKTLERENTARHRKVATHEETIEALQAEIQTIRADHSRQVLEMQQRHLLEKNETVTKHQTEVSRLNALLIKATEWFPWFRAMLRIEKLCLAVGFTHEQTAHLMTGKPLPYNGELYSDEHRRKFKTNDVTAKVGTNNGKLILAIDGLHIGEWFKKQFERLQQNVGLKPIQKKNKGFKL